MSEIVINITEPSPVALTVSNIASAGQIQQIKNITANGTFYPDSGYDGVAQINVDVPNASSGTVNITENGTYDVTEKASAVVNVQPTLQYKTATPTEQTQSVEADSGYYGLGTVTVNPIPSEYVVPTGSVSITANGTHNVSGKASAVVNVPSSIPYYMQQLTMSSSVDWKTLVNSLGYTPHYEESTIIIRSYGTYASEGGTYTVPCFIVSQKNNTVLYAIDFYVHSRNTPDYLFGALGRITAEFLSVVSFSNGVLSVSGTSSSQMGGIGTTVKVYESPGTMYTLPFTAEENE